MKNISSNFRLGVGSLMQFYLKSDVTKTKVALTKIMNDSILVITGTVVFQGKNSLMT